MNPRKDRAVPLKVAGRLEMLKADFDYLKASLSISLDTEALLAYTRGGGPTP
jgi:hypothetical protein